MRRSKFYFSNSNHHNYFCIEVSLFRIIMTLVIEEVELGMPWAMEKGLRGTEVEREKKRKIEDCIYII